MSETLALTVENMHVARSEIVATPLVKTEGEFQGRGRYSGSDFSLQVRSDEQSAIVRFPDGAPATAALTPFIDALFVRFPTVESVVVESGSERRTLRPETFYQSPDAWHYRGDRYPRPHAMTRTGDILHPLRPRPEGNLLYRRYNAGIDRTLSIRAFSMAEHFALFERWMNDPTVAEFWEMAWDSSRLRAYAEERLEDRHMVPSIGYFDDTPFAYFEIYWAKEDRLGPHYDAHDYDRGFHMAVGDANFRHQGFGRHWFLGMAHFLFLDDPRTMRLVGEPRVDQERVKGWSKTTPWEIVKEFSFPHKRAVLMMMSRDAFFRSYRI